MPGHFLPFNKMNLKAVESKITNRTFTLYQHSIRNFVWLKKNCDKIKQHAKVKRFDFFPGPLIQSIPAFYWRNRTPCLCMPTFCARYQTI